MLHFRGETKLVYPMLIFVEIHLEELSQQSVIRQTGSGCIRSAEMCGSGLVIFTRNSTMWEVQQKIQEDLLRDLIGL